jgi:parallel beta-helix repeat protein
LKFVPPSLTKQILPALLAASTLAACGGGTEQKATSSGSAASIASTSRADSGAANSAAPAERLASDVQICLGQSADPAGQVAASAAIQACIDQLGPGGTLELPPGTYLMNSQLKIAFPFTLRTLGLSESTQTCTDGANCATLKAAPTFFARYGILLVGGNGASVDHFVLDHVTLDGNRSARLTGAARDACVSGGSNNTYGFNATVQNCSSCKVVYSASVNALCGTGLNWAGNFATIENNIFARNGDHHAAGLWADGLSLHDSDDSSIQNNRLTDNSDVGLISFGSARAKIAGNVITQVNAEAFAGFMLDSLHTGDFTNTEIANNTVNCAPGKCFFGVNIGPRPWYPQNRPVFGGRIRGNTITGGTIGLNVGGTMAAGQLMHIGGNYFLGSFSGPRVACLKSGTLSQTAISRDPWYSPISLGDNYLNNVLVSPVLQSTDHCIS